MAGFTKDNILIGVMGVTGSGKSKFIQTMSDDLKIVVSKKRESCTKNVQACNAFEVDGRTVELVDTPGFSDSKMTDTQVLEKIATWLKEKFHKDQKLHGILYIHRITDIRMDGAAVRSLAVFSDICGPEFLSNTVMVTSMWDKLRDPEAVTDSEELEEELKDKEWRSLLDGGATYARSYNTQQCCRDIVRKIVAKSPKTPKLQAELGAGASLGDTAAGAGLRTELDKQAKLHKKELEKLAQKYAQALEAGERNIAAVLAKAKAEREIQVARDRKDQEKLRTVMERQIKDLAEQARKKDEATRAELDNIQKATALAKINAELKAQAAQDRRDQDRQIELDNIQKATALAKINAEREAQAAQDRRDQDRQISYLKEETRKKDETNKAELENARRAAAEAEREIQVAQQKKHQKKLRRDQEAEEWRHAECESGRQYAECESRRLYAEWYQASLRQAPVYQPAPYYTYWY